MGNDADKELFRLLSELVMPTDSDEGNNSRRTALWDGILAMLESGQTTDFGLLQTFTTLFQKADRLGKMTMLFLMRDLIDFSTSHGGYGYPELFWLVLESNLLFEFTDISDVGRQIAGFLCRTGGVQATRSYLTHILLGDDKTKHINAFLAFYPTGHSLQSLRITMEVAPEPDESNIQLFVFIYADAWQFLATNKSIDLTDTDRSALKSFFRRGLALSNQFVLDYCQKSIALLEGDDRSLVTN